MIHSKTIGHRLLDVIVGGFFLATMYLVMITIADHVDRRSYNKGYHEGLAACEATAPPSHGTYLTDPEPPVTID